MPLLRRHRGGSHGGGGGGRMKGHHSEDDESTPICRCRVLYLGSAVPHITKDGLQGIQEPLKELYPDTGLSSLKGIDSWLSVWSNGLLLENVDEKNTKITRFFPIESLHYCAAVRNVIVPSNSGSCNSSLANGASSSDKSQKFLPLDSPFAQLPNLNHPPLFACILRRTTGIKVLECHAFICKREMAANALVRCCFHAYADSTYAKQLENGGTSVQAPSTNGGTLLSNGFSSNGTIFKDNERPIQRSVTPLDSIEKVAGWQALSQNGDSDIIVLNSGTDDYTDGPTSSSTPRDKIFEFKAEFPFEEEIYEGDENHKIWSGNNSTLGHNGTSSELVYLEPDGTLKSIRSQMSRVSRPRQFISPPPPPPPPPQQLSMLKSTEEDISLSKKKMKKKIKKEIKQHQQGKGNGQAYLVRPASMMNLSTNNPPHAIVHSNGRGGGSLINGPTHRPNSAMSTMPRHQPPQQQLIAMPQHHLHNGYPMIATMQHPQPVYGHVYTLGHRPPPQLIKGVKSKKGGKSKPSMLTPVPILAPTPHHRMGPNAYPHYQPPHLVPATVINHAAPSSAHHRDDMRGMKGRPPPQEMLLMQPPSPAQYATIERGYHYKSRPLNGDSTLVSNKSKQKVQPNSRPRSGRDIVPMNGNGIIGSHNNMSNGHSHSRNRDNSPFHLNNGNGIANNGHDSRNSRQRRDSSPFNTGIHHMGSHNHTDSNSSSRNGGPVDPEGSPFNTGIYRKKSQQSSHNNTDSGSSKNKDPEGSPFNTGIYRKKGHLNERAFSYSIRQEHRSRSYGSLTNLQFANSNETGDMLLSRPSGSPHTSEGIKKEREIIQMVRDLDLSGDHIERSQVPSDLYPSPRKLLTNGYRQQNGHGPRITHR